MRNLTLDDKSIQQLTQDQYSVAASIYMPIHGTAEPQAISEDSSRLNSMVHHLKSELSDQQRYELRHRLDELRELVGSIDFWRDQSGSSIAFFVQPHEIYSVELPLELSEHIFIDTTFMLGPLLAQLVDDTRYLVLSLNRAQPKLFRGDRSGLREVVVNDMPGEFREALNIDELVQRQQQFHTGEGTAGRAMYHGQGSVKDKADTDLGRYVRMVRDAVLPTLHDERLPLVLVGAEKMVAQYRASDDYTWTVEESVGGNYEQAQMAELHQRTWPIMEHRISAIRQTHIDELEQMAATQPQRVTTDMRAIMSAALAGKIHKLFLTLTEKTRDSVKDGMSSTWLERFYRGTQGKELSQALLEAWRHRGEIIFAHDLPSNKQVAAILRY